MVERSCAGCVGGGFTRISPLLSPATTDWRCNRAGAVLASPRASTVSKPCSDKRAIQPSLHILHEASVRYSLLTSVRSPHSTAPTQRLCEQGDSAPLGRLYRVDCVRAPADDGGAGDAELGIVEQPPAICQAKGECQEVCLGGELVGNQQASLAQQSLALLQRPAHAACGMQHVCRKENVELSGGVALHKILGCQRVCGKFIALPDLAAEAGCTHGL